ncbi:MarR family winged helix-turn-helix transcriptional regulator [Frisingicoccus sp.]|uniref:MarR family winged helix-turn-helix transcriptional regulator n=1 Tax=Frisingicoccus sp. TaxID=1918627 RepID=UPI003AB33743
MKNRKMQEEMFRAMFRLKHLNMGGMLKEISVGEYKILEMCSGCPQCGAREKGIYVSSMAAEMKVSSPAVSRLLKGMEGKDYIVRHADSKDRRNTRVFITEAGLKKRDECREILWNYTERVIGRMGMENMLQLLNLFNQMVDVMEDELKKTEKGDRIC